MVFELPALESPDTAWSCHIPFAFWIMEALRPRVLVELGVHTGVSYCAFCQAAQGLGLPTTPYGVDTWAGDAHAGNYGESVLNVLRTHHDPRYGGFSHLVQATFDEAREHFAPGSVDLLHIDGYHTYEAVRHDFETWLPAMSTQGVILFHDVTVRDRDFGVWRLWDELTRRYPGFLFPFGHGLGVLGVGADLPEPVQWLLHPEVRPDTPDDAIARFFAPLGQGLEARAGMTRAMRELAAVRGGLAAAQGELAAARGELAATRDAMEHERAEASRAAENLQGQVEFGECELAAMRASTSWRLTAPLRGGSAAARGLARRARQALRRRATARMVFAEDAETLPDIQSSLRSPLREAWYEATTPEVSLIVLNYNKPGLTFACLDSIWRHTAGFRYEVVLVDNGSEPELFLKLAPLAAGARIVRVGVNRYFGEGNNIGFEAARGRYVVFLNNDVTVTPNWLAPLVERLADVSIGGIGPMMVYPDGRLQEAGARVKPDGLSEQYGKGGDPEDPAWAVERDVDYVSAAAFAMRREAFEAALGFDLCYEPAYYEDADLCMKLHQLGLRVVYCPASRIVHHENATSRRYAKALHIDSVIGLNRQHFVARWQAVLKGEKSRVPGIFPPPAATPTPPEGAPSLLLYTPYPLVPGGGERYLLTLAAGLSASMRVTLATEHPYSRLRLRTLGRELSLNLDAVKVVPLEHVPRDEAFDWGIVMGNEVVPSQPALARRNLYICQFPFPAEPGWLGARWDLLDDYEGVVVYSPFVERHYARALSALGKGPQPISVVRPPAALAPQAAAGAPIAAKLRMVVSVGRFFPGGHDKRHDLMIKAFARLLKTHPGATLHLAGSLSADPVHIAHFDSLRQQAAGLPVTFYPNASPATIARLYDEASVYWHLGGYGVDESTEAYRCEHFGITVVEAMSAGCLTLVVNRGGPPSIVEHGVTGYVFDTLDELVALTGQVLAAPAGDAALAAMREAAVAASRQYTAERMVGDFSTLMRPRDEA